MEFNISTYILNYFKTINFLLYFNLNVTFGIISNTLFKVIKVNYVNIMRSAYRLAFMTAILQVYQNVI